MHADSFFMFFYGFYRARPKGINSNDFVIDNSSITRLNSAKCLKLLSM